MTAGILRILSNLCLAYLVAWTFGYVIVVSDGYGRIDWSYYGKYIQLFWSGSGLERPLWVISGHSRAYHANGCYRAYSGRSISPFRIAISECPLYSIAVIQTAIFLSCSLSAFGQKQPFIIENRSVEEAKICQAAISASVVIDRYPTMYTGQNIAKNL